MEAFAAQGIVQVTVDDAVKNMPEAKALQKSINQIAATRDGQALVWRLRDWRKGRPLEVQIADFGVEDTSNFDVDGGAEHHGVIRYNIKNLNRHFLTFNGPDFFDMGERRISPLRLAFHKIYHSAAKHEKESLGLGAENSARHVTNLFMKKYHGDVFEKQMKGKVAGNTWKTTEGHDIDDLGDKFHPVGDEKIKMNLSKRMIDDARRFGSATKTKYRAFEPERNFIEFVMRHDRDGFFRDDAMKEQYRKLVGGARKQESRD